jgi:pimeloyl-ACP methyl ester carboxylesterase
LSSSATNEQSRLFFSERGSGDPVVFIHGIGGDYRMWDNQLNSLSKKCRAISYSRRSSYPNKCQVDDQRAGKMEGDAGDLIALFNELNIANANIVGHSYGGAIAAYFAYKYPEKVRSLILIEPAIVSVFIENPSSRRESLSFFLRHPSLALAFLDFARKVNPSLKALDMKDFEIAARIFMDGLQNRQGAFEELPEDFRNIVIENVTTIHDLEISQPVFKRDQIRQIKAPTLIVKGQTSHKILRDIADSLNNVLPNSRLEMMHSGHFPQIEKPDALNMKILDFLDKKS